MNKPWQPYALHILDMIEKIHRIEARGSIVDDEILYDATLRNLQTLSEATQQLPEEKNHSVLIFHGEKSVVFVISWFITIWVTLQLIKRELLTKHLC